MLSLLMVMTMKVKIAIGKSLLNLSKQDLPFYTFHPFLNKSVLILFDLLVSNSLHLKQCTLLNAYSGCFVIVLANASCFQHNAAVIFVQNLTLLLCLSVKMTLEQMQNGQVSNCVWYQNG